MEYPAAYPGVLSVGATDTQGGGFCSFSNRGEGLRLLAPGCDLDGAEPTTGAPNYNYWQGTSEASAIAARGARRARLLPARLVARSGRERPDGSRQRRARHRADLPQRGPRSDRRGRRSGRARGTVELDPGIVSAAGDTIDRDEAHAAIRTPASPTEASQAPPRARPDGTPQRSAGAGPLPRPQRDDRADCACCARFTAPSRA